MEDEDTIHAIDSWENDDTFLESIKATIEMEVTRHAHLELTPTQELNYVTSPWPFSI